MGEREREREGESHEIKKRMRSHNREGELLKGKKAKRTKSVNEIMKIERDEDKRRRELGGWGKGSEREDEKMEEKENKILKTKKHSQSIRHTNVYQSKILKKSSSLYGNYEKLS